MVSRVAEDSAIEVRAFLGLQAKAVNSTQVRIPMMIEDVVTVR